MYLCSRAHSLTHTWFDTDGPEFQKLRRSTPFHTESVDRPKKPLPASPLRSVDMHPVTPSHLPLCPNLRHCPRRVTPPAPPAPLPSSVTPPPPVSPLCPPRPASRWQDFARDSVTNGLIWGAAGGGAGAIVPSGTPSGGLLRHVSVQHRDLHHGSAVLTGPAACGDR